MHVAQLEHINLTVGDSDKTASWLCRVFDWDVRWSGPSIHGGYSVHVGGKNNYMALYSAVPPSKGVKVNYTEKNGLNHVGIVVDDLEQAESRIIKAGYAPYSHQDYEPGRRFYFRDEDGVEYEVISYAQKAVPRRRRFMAKLGALSKYGALMK